MYSSRGRGGFRAPSRGTPANVQCQKCLKRGHYSYECKATLTERPYTSRPSRTQQLSNPKLVPRLTSSVPEELQRKKGIADEELAKKEAERAKKELEEAEEEVAKDLGLNRQRSGSVDSVSTISTSDSASPPPRRRSRPPRSPDSRSRSVSPAVPSERRRSFSSASSEERQSPRAMRGRQESPSPRKFRGRSESRSRSPPREYARSYRERDHSPEARGEREQLRRSRYSPSYNRSSLSRDDTRSASRSPPRRGDRDKSRERGSGSARQEVGRWGVGRAERASRGRPAREAQKERSPSPFSKRLALTQAMNMGR